MLNKFTIEIPDCKEKKRKKSRISHCVVQIEAQNIQAAMRICRCLTDKWQGEAAFLVRFENLVEKTIKATRFAKKRVALLASEKFLFFMISGFFVYFLLSATATATATVAPTMGLLPMPRKPIIST